MKAGRTVLWWVVGVLIIAASLGVSLLLFVTVNEYRPEAVEKLDPNGGTKTISEGGSLRITTLNTGYAGLSADEDFFMDGGTGVNAKSRAQVTENLNGIVRMLKDTDSDVYFLQEVDVNSDRTFGINEAEIYELQTGLEGVFAYNYKASWVPYPMPPIGHIEAGLLTLTDLDVTEAQRIQLPVSFSWPVSTCNLKRCLLVERVPVTGSDRELVLVNLHLEAYDEGDGKAAQTRALGAVLEAELRRGNYVVAGGDFNQTFEGSRQYPVVNEENWTPGIVGPGDVPYGFRLVYDDEIPTCRLLDSPYAGSWNESQVYVIDGFIVSDNVDVKNVSVTDWEFQYTDHQPVVLDAVLERV